jgi:hypothetical protein
MAHGKAMLGEEHLNITGEPEQPEHIGDCGPVFARALCNLLVAELVFPCQAVEGLGDLNGIQILALDVLNEGDFHEPVVGIVLNDDRNLGKAGKFGGAPAALSGDELVAGTGGADDQRLDNAVFADGLGEFLEAVGLEDGARLQGIGVDIADGNPEWRR